VEDKRDDPLGKRPSPEVGPGALERLIEQYESIRYQIPRFNDLSPSERKELFDRTWSLRERVYEARDIHSGQEVALLHDALSHAALYFIEVIEVALREREQSPGEAAPEELLGGIGSVTRLDEYRQHLKVS
jgi:hypothetical protein